MFDPVHFLRFVTSNDISVFGFSFDMIPIMLTDLYYINFRFSFNSRDQTRIPLNTKLVCYMNQSSIPSIQSKNFAQHRPFHILTNCRIICCMHMFEQK
jgi:hypothetical protein